jgi:hypothetical protein
MRKRTLAEKTTVSVVFDKRQIDLLKIMADEKCGITVSMLIRQALFSDESRSIRNRIKRLWAAMREPKPGQGEESLPPER